ncbi:GntR family transcriptional regulator [Lactobacillus sp. ESL0677]|uniref:GntR family transcriptional regulator n=1 Tax=Lactobacillus sp. ESL0677 TaxID=2983208 RepID=UPI0023F9D036|nr:GntR family transcriptional regulator [Lactobacillus sp. ESL0677]WEV37342.1 GntR family transcriptional regulator [Lactobacillus sp. ESL0677]
MKMMKNDKPLYLQIASLIKSNIYSNKYYPTQKLPTESELCALYSVSKITVRKAIKILEAQNLVKKIRGKGTFVKVKKESLQIGKDSVGFTDFFSTKGQQLESQFLQTQIINEANELPEEIQAKFSVPVVYIKRLFIREGVPIGLDNLYVSGEEFPKFIEKMLTSKGLYNTLLEYYGVKITKSELKIDGIMAVAEYADELKCALGDPLFVVKKDGYTADNHLIHSSKSIVRCDRIEYKFTI